MLLLIALANVPWFLYGRTSGTAVAHHTDATGLDAVWQAISLIFIDARSYPLFAFLFGYGLWQMYRRQAAAGVAEPDARRLIIRRSAWLIAFGAVHALLLWMGDVLGAYGLVGVIIGWLFLRRRDRTLLIWAGALATLVLFSAASTVVGGVMVVTFAPDMLATMSVALPDANAVSSYPESMAWRIGLWVMMTLAQAFVSLTVPVAVLLGIWAARRGVLEQPLQHLTLLRRTAVWGLALGWGGGALTALSWFGLLGFPAGTDWIMSGWHTFTGVAAGLGYAAAFGLIAARLQQRRPGALTRAVSAVGKRSLTSYVSQSVLIAPVLAAWGLGWGGWMSAWQGAVFAVVVWIITVLVAVALERAGRRGPLEALLRRLSYGRRPLAPATAVTTSPTAS